MLYRWQSCNILHQPYLSFAVVTPWTAARQASLSVTNSQSLLRVMSMESVMPSNQLILCRPLLLPPSSFPSLRVFSMSQFIASGGQNSGASASASVLLMNTQEWSDLRRPGWISLKSKESLLGLAISLQSQESPPTLHFQSISSSMLSFLYGPALTSICDSGKTIALTVRTFTGKVMSLLFNTLSRFVIAFPPRSTCFLYSL